MMNLRGSTHTLHDTPAALRVTVYIISSLHYNYTAFLTYDTYISLAAKDDRLHALRLILQNQTLCEKNLVHRQLLNGAMVSAKP